MIGVTSNLLNLVKQFKLRPSGFARQFQADVWQFFLFSYQLITNLHHIYVPIYYNKDDKHRRISLIANKNIVKQVKLTNLNLK